ncbi:hypothetical protein GA0116948_1442 [Chitinophaga costaii]|uniref:Uncharacterized protein n=1 Tax=Chitinophaga costaii TaxID=1335309 RepID=A0A1C4GAG1_9BACT|nr:hypothetical protein [Chitinophaga costaii]PUZ18966.1 hypothetical protein DCM91_20980 [Chitinophaga costaii]SCC65124.1 hypothetical protein GA0116948_1442 [Chitinophaga costaii]
MIEHIFFNMNGEIESVAEIFFSSLGIKANIVEGRSFSSSTGVYYSFSIFGIVIRLEGNCYDYDNEYAYMVGIKEDFLSGLIINDESTLHLANIIIQLLIKNLKIPIAYEIEFGKIKVYMPDEDLS